MNFNALVRRSLSAVACMLVASAYAQPAVIQSLFDETPGRTRGARNAITANTTATTVLANKPGNLLLRQFPLVNGGYAGFELEPMEVFADNAHMTIVSAGGTTHSIELPQVKAWRGRETGGGERSLFLTQRTDGSLGAMVTGDSHTSDTVVMPEAGGSEYSIRSSEIPARDYCGVGDMVPSDFATQIGDSAMAARAPEVASLGTGTRQVELMLDISYSTYQKLGSDNNRVADYITQLMGTVATIYKRDIDVRLVVSSVFVWSSPDPFNSDHNGNGRLDTGDQLDLYQAYVRNNRATVDRDLAHLINFNRSLGGVAYVNVLCRKDYGMGVSNVYADLAFPSDINSYYWDTMVVAHEMGHNFGSPHTHCYPEPLDCCATQPSCSSCTSAQPQAGTIMSYCHTQIGRGGNVVMKFHDRVVTEIRARVDAAPCLTPYVAGTPRVEVAGDTGVVIRNGDMTPSTIDGTDMSSTEVRSSHVTRHFIIGNPGSADLNFTNWVGVQGSRQFSITLQPHTDKLTPGAATYFGVTFDPAIQGQHEAIVSVSSSDPATPSYQFKIKASAAHRSGKQIFMSTSAVAIPDLAPQSVTLEIPVSNVTGGILDLDFAFQGTDCSQPGSAGLEYPSDGNLVVTLESPRGTRVLLMDNPGSGSMGTSGYNFCGTVFDDEAGAPSIDDISLNGAGALAPPHSGVLSPHQPLRSFYGEPANGMWKLHITGTQATEGGWVRGVALEIVGSTTALRAAAEGWDLYQ